MQSRSRMIIQNFFNMCYTCSSAVIPHYALPTFKYLTNHKLLTSSLPGAARCITIGSLDSKLSTCNETKLSSICEEVRRDTLDHRVREVKRAFY